VKLEVVTIGTELLLGFTQDTNAAELGRALAGAGVEVVRHSSVADRPDAIRAAVREALARTGFVITTGGLGPTRDDMTKQEVAALFGKPLELRADILQSLEARFRRLGRPMPAANRTQAEVPQGATVLPNPRGTAPGLWVEDAESRVVVMLPGVPSEMRGLLAEEVLPRLAERQARAGGERASLVVRSRTVRTTGIAESALAERIGAIEDDIVPLTLAYIPSTDGVDLRLTGWRLLPQDAEHRLMTAAAALRARAGDHVYGEDNADLAATILELLRARRCRLAVAESCTGGLLGGRITAVPGSSDVFAGGIIAYDDHVKRDLLEVSRELIQAHGAVSEEVASAMAGGARRRFNVDAALAVTGIAGPGGGTPEKPVGTVWLAARVGDDVRTLKRMFPGDRGEIRARSAQAALDLLRRLLGKLGS
jgi:nicotinamide-nucleotide amidase